MEKEQVLENTLGVYLTLLKEYWYTHSFLSYQWWTMILITIIPWFIWWKFVDKKRLMEILLFGLLMMFTTVLVAPLEQNLNLLQFIQRIHWSLTTPLYPYEITILPVSFMFIYQYSKNWTSYVIGTLFLSCFLVFILIPVLIKLDYLFFVSYLSFVICFTLLIIFSLLSRWILSTHFFKKGNVNYD